MIRGESLFKPLSLLGRVAEGKLNVGLELEDEGKKMFDDIFRNYLSRK